MNNQELKQKLIHAMEAFSTELRSLRIGRASADMVERINVEVYGSMMPIEQIASIQVPEHDQIIIQPWDAQILNAVATALRNSELNINPVVDGNIIRLKLPPVTEERRRESVKRLHQLAEEARIVVRHLRDETMKEIESAEDKKEFSEDAAHRAKEETQRTVDEYNNKIKESTDKKEQEILGFSA